LNHPLIPPPEPMHIVALADLHGRLPVIPPCDIVLIAGDICPDVEFRVAQNDPDLIRVEQMRWLADEFNSWRCTLPRQVRQVLATPGNHDYIVRFPECATDAEGPPAHLYIDELVEVDGKRFYFTPWVSECGDWNYIANREQRRYRFHDIPSTLDVLVAHSPAYQVGDRAWDNRSCGCPELRYFVKQRMPRKMVFGHIHEGRRDGREYRLGNSKLYHCSMWGATWTPVEFVI
jgi:Icc-related predicted phosphoesterase